MVNAMGYLFLREGAKKMSKQNNSILETMSVNSLIMKFSIPCILSLLVSSLYNIVDQIFIGRGVGYLGNGATNVVFPITVIALAIALMIGDGCAAFLSICQGKKEQQKANSSVGNAILLLLIASLLLVVFFICFRDSILYTFGATENIYDYAVTYFDVIVIGIPFYIFANGLNSVIRADGAPQFAMITTLIGCVMNIILDPIAIFVLHMGVYGAAIATILGQIVSAVCAIYYVFHAKTFQFTLSGMKLDFSTIRAFLPLGISSLITQLSIVVIMGVMNSTLVKWGAMSEYGAEIPMTVVGIVMKVFQIVIAFVVGIAAGCQPIIGYNFGAGNRERVQEIFRKILVLEIAIGILSTIAFEFFPLQIIGLFGSESALYNQFAVLSFRIFLSTIVLCCIQKSISIFLQAIGKPGKSMFLSLLREFLLSVPLIIVLPYCMHLGVEGPLFSAPIADCISTFTALWMMHSFFVKYSQDDTVTIVFEG